MVNVELLRDTMRHIRENPQQWRQEAWFYHENQPVRIEIQVEEVNSCGSSFCFAGHAALKAGFVAPPKSNNYSWVRHNEDGSYTYVDRFAADQLGLTDEQAEILFSAGNTMEDLEWIVEAIIENPNIGYDGLLVGRPSYNEDEEPCECGCTDLD